MRQVELHSLNIASEEAFHRNGSAAWTMLAERLRRELGDRTFESWLKPLGAAVSGDLLTLAAPSRFMADWIRNHFLERIRQNWVAIRPGGEVQLVLRSNLVFSEATPPVEQTAAVPAPASDGFAFEPRYSFDNFVVGKANELAYNAARAIAEGGRMGFNPLFLHGITGLGKTHLMHAIAQEVQMREPGARVAYLSAERFMVEFLEALRAKDTISFKQRLRTVDVLMIDDVQFIAGKESTQEEFFHTMNEVMNAGKRLVITADRSPQSLEGIQERILSRLAWGLVADINPADYELRLNILLMKLSQMDGITVPQDVVEFLAKRVTANVRELEGALNRVVAYAQLKNSVIDIDFTREVLSDQLRAYDRKISIDEIQKRVAEHYRIRPAEMTSARRAREVARPRQVAMYLAKRLTPRSLPEIGRRFGGRDHTTVMHAVKRIESLRAEDAELDGDLVLLTRRLEG